MNPLLIVRFLAFLVPAIFLLFGPQDAVVKRLWDRKPLRVWHYETAVVIMFLALVVLCSGNHPLEWVGFAALSLAHGRNSVMFRLAEEQAKMAANNEHRVECFRWSRIYFVSAESFWAYYFYEHKAWSALAGVVVFVGYAEWRRWYTRPRKPEECVENVLCTGCEWCTNCRARKNWPPA